MKKLRFTVATVLAITLSLMSTLLGLTLSTTSATAAWASAEKCKLSNLNGQNVNLGMPRSSLLLPSRGRVKILVAGVDFSNARETGFAEQMVAGFELAKVNDFFSIASYGNLNLDFTIVQEVLKLSISDTGASELMISQETAKVLPSTYKLSEYSALLIITTKNSSYSSSTASAGSMVENATGRLTNYSVLAGIKPNESRWLSSPWRTVVHELGHLLGLMDLWNREDSGAWQGQTAAPFSIMNTGAGWDYAADFFAWEKWVLGWIPDSDVKCLERDSGDITTGIAGLDSKSGVRLIVIPITSNKALAVEYRKKSVLDFGITKPGVLVYTVDSSKKNFELPIQIVPSEESMQQPLSDTLKDYARFKKSPISTFDSVESVGLQIANLGVLEGKEVLISPKSRAEIKKYLSELESQAKLVEEAEKRAATEKAAAELKAKQEAEAKAAAELKAKQEAEAKAAAELKAKQEAEAKTAAEKAAAELKAKQEAEAKAAAEKAAAELKAKQEAEAKAKAEAAKKNITITCVKGKTVKKVTAVNPKCPKGYKKK